MNDEKQAEAEGVQPAPDLLVGNLVAATLAEERAHEGDEADREKDDAADRFIRAKDELLRALKQPALQENQRLRAIIAGRDSLLAALATARDLRLRVTFGVTEVSEAGGFGAAYETHDDNAAAAFAAMVRCASDPGDESIHHHSRGGDLG